MDEPVVVRCNTCNWQYPVSGSPEDFEGHLTPSDEICSAPDMQIVED